MDNREKVVVRTSIIGIIANVFLAGFKAFVGLMSHSVAIVMDAVNNLSDALSSIITIIGAKLSNKAPDRKHPLGYGRVEYLSEMIIAVIIIYAGISSLIESVKKIIDPATPDYKATGLIIVAVAVAVKIVLGIYVQGKGKAVSSDSLIASGKDAIMDSIISASTLVAAGIYIATGLSLEAWLGAVISLIIIKTGLEILMDTISSILGERIDGDLSRAIKETVKSHPGVSGAYDLVITSYGPNMDIGAVHIQVPEDMTAVQLDRLERDIQAEVYRKHNVILAGISVYSTNNSDPVAGEMHRQVLALMNEYREVIQIHGFYVDQDRKTVRFDVVISFGCDREAIYEEIQHKVQDMFPGYSVFVALDTDISD